MRALKREDFDALASMESTPFELLGVLFELNDVSPIHRLYGHKEKLYHDLRQRTAMALNVPHQQSVISAASDQSAASILSNTHMKDEWRMLKDATAYLTQEIGGIPLHIYPIDGLLPITEIFEEIKDQAEISDIHIAAELPDHLSLVMAEPEQLHELTVSVLNTLIKDATEGGTIHIIVEEQDDWIRYLFYNEGFGMPNDRLQEYLFDDVSVTEDYTQLRSVLHRVRNWGGIVEAHSELGVGTKIEIKLRAFTKKALANS
jgi:signal transduction histidine kinase